MKLRKNERAILAACDEHARTGMEIAGRARLVGNRAIAGAITALYSKNLIGAVDYAPIKYVITDAGRSALAVNPIA